MMKITAVRIQNFKRIKDVTITPVADRALILIGGKNGQGKSSTLDALTAAFGGKKSLPTDPVLHGADEAEISIELDGGERTGLTVCRVIQADGESNLQVRDSMGERKAPQEVLDKLVGTRFLDPIRFIQLPAKEQRAQLMKLIPEAERIAELNGKRERAFTKRTEVGRDLTKAEGEAARLEERKVGAPVDVAALSAERSELAEKQRAGDGLGRTLADRRRETEAAVLALNDNDSKCSAIEAQIEKLQADLADRRAKDGELKKTLATRKTIEAETQAKLDAAGAEWAKLAPRGAEIDAAIAKAGETNRAVYEAEAHNKRRAEAQASVTALKLEVDRITAAIEVVDNRKAEILAAAKLPVEGLSVDDEGVTLNGVPFAQASGAEKLRVALALAIAASPGLADVWIRDGALLDDESLALVQVHAKATGNCVWIERVGTADEGVIVIADGKVQESKA